jgi:hypothetical protein
LNGIAEAAAEAAFQHRFSVNAGGAAAREGAGAEAHEASSSSNGAAAAAVPEATLAAAQQELGSAQEPLFVMVGAEALNADNLVSVGRMV